jgi:hypothetical protein
LQGKGDIATKRKKIKRHIYGMARFIPNRRNYMWTGREANESEVGRKIAGLL